jgi:hypothetical protein
VIEDVDMVVRFARWRAQGASPLPALPDTTRWEIDGQFRVFLAHSGARSTLISRER